MAPDLDIPAILEATAWPFVVLVIFLLYRHRLTVLVDTLGRKVRKVDPSTWLARFATPTPGKIR